MASKKSLRIFQLLFLVLIVAAAIRVMVIMRGRGSMGAATPKAAPALPLNREAYVVPKKLYISNLKSAQQLTKQPVWVREGYRYTVYPYAHNAADFKHPAGMLLPIQRLQIKDVGTSGKQLIAIFDEDGKPYAVPIGLRDGSDYTFYADEMFFYENPHDLFNFWPPETWQAIERHEVTRGMNEYQAAFAIGMGTPQPGGDANQKTVVYPRDGNPLVVKYQNGKAIDIQPGRPTSSSVLRAKKTKA